MRDIVDSGQRGSDCLPPSPKRATRIEKEFRITPVIHRFLFVALIAVFMSGCATSRSEIGLAKPEPEAGTRSREPDTIAILSVTDERVFKVEPKKPSTPSLGFGGADEASAAVRARALGRKRGGYGQALGDVLLKEGSSVNGVIREHVAAAAREAGYRVVESGEADVTLDVTIDRFWSWVDPGVFTIKLTTVLETDLVLSDEYGTRRINVRPHDGYGMITDSTWKESIETTLEKYRGDVASVFDDLG